jgi:uncharacterized protein (UPF0332 family)
MNESERKTLACYWLEKARHSLARAEADVADESYSFAVSRLYYAVFYAVSAALAAEGKTYGKHSAVRSMFNRHYVKEGTVAGNWETFTMSCMTSATKATTNRLCRSLWMTFSPNLKKLAFSYRSSLELSSRNLHSSAVVVR